MQPWQTLGLSAVLTLGLAAAADAQSRTPRDALVIAQNLGTFVTLDPAAINESGTALFMRNVCDSLVQINPDDTSKVGPGLAERWTVSPDGKEWTFHLRPGMVHQSGNPVTAHDIVWTMQRTLKLNLANAQRLGEWEFTPRTIEQAVTAPNDLTVVIRPARPFAPSLFPMAGADFRIIAALDRVEVMKNERNGDMGNAWLTTNTACYGPFRVTALRASEIVTLERNDRYWRAGQIAMRRVLIRHAPEASAQRLLLERGDIDIATQLNTADLPAIQANPNTRLRNELDFELYHLLINHKHERLRNPALAEALRWLVDYQGLIETTLKNAAIIRQSPVAFGAFGALPKEETPYRLDIARARQILQAAGLTDLRVELTTQNIFPYPELAQHIQQNAAQAGLQIQVRTMASAQLFTQMRGRGHEIALSSYSPNYPDSNNFMLRLAYNPDNREEARLTTMRAWRTAWDPGAERNRQMLAAQEEQDEAKRIASYHDQQRWFMREAPILMLFQRIEAMGLSASLRDFKSNGLAMYYWSAVK
jgi:peptide/nickel transport system substrate-binding protein